MSVINVVLSQEAELEPMEILMGTLTAGTPRGARKYNYQVQVKAHLSKQGNVIYVREALNVFFNNNNTVNTYGKSQEISRA